MFETSRDILFTKLRIYEIHLGYNGNILQTRSKVQNNIRAWIIKETLLSGLKPNVKQILQLLCSPQHSFHHSCEEDMKYSN